MTNHTSGTLLCRLVVVSMIGASTLLQAAALPAQEEAPIGSTPLSGLKEAQRMFYNGRYADAAALSTELCSAEDGLAACELRTSAILFQIKRAIGDPPDKDKAFKLCTTCPALLSDFVTETTRSQGLARAKLQANAGDDATLFLLGKLDLNYVWLQLETLGRKTGWSEYWEARRSLDAALKGNPQHMRARVARAWVDFIVDTKMTRGTRWVLGGGSKKRAFIGAREAAAADSEFFVRAEAEFALWEMLVRDRQLPEATTIAQRLAHDFPEHHKIANFLKTAPGVHPEEAARRPSSD